MYSVLPAIVALLFLGYGLYVVSSQGFTATTGTFFALCFTTFAWQFTWAVLFQTHEPALALPLVKFGYLLILFLPTTLYHFLVELAGPPREKPFVYLSYIVAALLAGFLVGSDLFVTGYHDYFWGYYPKAGPLHPVHVAQTAIVVSRGLYIVWRQQRTSVLAQRARLRLCTIALFIYSLAAVDYLCNYGIEFYPPGVVFIAISLGLLARAIVKHDLFSHPLGVAASMAHEIRTPLATLRMQATSVARYWEILFEGYQAAVRHGLVEPRLRERELRVLERLSRDIEHEVHRSNLIVDFMLAASTMEKIDRSQFTNHSARRCLDEALLRYPFPSGGRDRISVDSAQEFRFFGSDLLLEQVLFNLIRNALHATAGKGTIHIALQTGDGRNAIVVTDTGTGVPRDVLPRIFEPYFSTRHAGAGIGLAFCRRVMEVFGGKIRCDSTEGERTTFTLSFPAVPGIGESERAQGALGAA